MSLADKTCLPCRGGLPPLTRAQLRPLLPQIARWTVVSQKRRPHHLSREFEFPDFKTALAFVDAIGAEAERQGHHPDLELGWGRVAVSIHTHKIHGLAEADCILAARIDRIHQRLDRPKPNPSKRKHPR
jgi:4a-hydroxytetrahydrobiopterin dehydratase